MTYYFEKVLKAIKQENCFSQISGAEIVLLNAHMRLREYNRYRNTERAAFYKNMFMETCEAGRCLEALDRFVASLTF